MEHNNIQPNNTYNASFAPHTPSNANQQQGASPQAEPIPPLGNAPDLSASPAVRNLQAYNTISIRQGPTDSWNVQEYQPIQPGELGIEKLADEAKNTTKLNMYLENAQKNEELEDFKDAEEAYEKALRYTENAEHYKLYAACLSKLSASLQDKDQANVYGEKAARAFYYLGELYAKQGVLQEAQAAYKASIELALYEVPLKALVAVARQLGEARELADALEKLADFYAGKGDTALAIQMLEEALQVEKSSTILEKLATLHAQIGGEDSQFKVNETRIQQFELQISQDSKNISLYRQYVWFLKDIGQRNAARAVKERMDTQLQAVQRELFQDLQQNFQTLEQKLVKQKTKIGGLKQTIQSQDGKLETLAKQLEFLGGQVVYSDFSQRPDIQDADLIPLLKKNPYVQSLNLRGCEYLTDAVLHILPEHFENLEELNLTRCKGVTEAGLDAIAENAFKLKRLTLDYCPVTTIRLLHKLNAKGIAFTIEGVVFKENVLNLSERKDDLTDEELLKVLKANPEITKLNLENCKRITNAGLAHIKHFQWLTSLNLSSCEEITDEGLGHLTGLSQLTLLYLYNCNQITDEGLHHLTGLSQLKNLSLSSCKKITDGGLGHLTSFSQLETLYLRWTNITDDGLSHLTSLSQLKKLYLSSCSKVSSNTKEDLKRQIPGLTIE